MTVQISIIGMGQIGTSIGLALAQHTELVLRVGHDRELAAANLAKKMREKDVIVVNLSGRGDKDLEQAQAALGRIGRWKKA